MANPRTVINPFTKNEHRMRRNTESTTWVTTGASKIARKNVDFETRTPQRTSQEFILSSDVQDGSSRTRAPSSMRDETKPLPPMSSAVRTSVSYRDTPLAALQLIDFLRLEKILKKSNTTVFPHCSASTEKPELRTNSSWRKQALDESSCESQFTLLDQTQFQQQGISNSIPCYRAARQIYDIGPKGEGQKVWEAYQQARSHRQSDSKPLQNTPSEPTVNKRNEEPLPPPFPTSPDGVLFPPLRPRSSQTQSGGKEEEPGSPGLRRDSGFSSSSYGITISVDEATRSSIDANRPLLLVPGLDTAPTVRRAKDRPSGDSRQHTEKEATHTWWKHSSSREPQSLKSKISHPGPLMASNEGITVNIAAECGGVGGPAAAVSLPVTHTGAPLPRPHSSHEKKKEAGRPSPRSFYLPTVHLSPPKNKSKGKENAKVDESHNTHPTHWHDKLVGPAYEVGKSLKHTAMETLDGVHVGRKRRTSDVSFACQGIVGEKLDRYQVSEQSSSDNEKDMVPDPLFYVKDTWANRKSH